MKQEICQTLQRNMDNAHTIWWKNILRALRMRYEFTKYLKERTHYPILNGVNFKIETLLQKLLKALIY